MLKPLWIFFVLLASPILANEALKGTKTIHLLDVQNRQVAVGRITFSPAQKHTTYQIHIDHAKFKDFFLSMKEMKCLEGPELWCHLPYPYETPRQVTATDLTWLAHDLLFMYKKKSEFGANFYNGIYYQLRIEDGVIVGSAHAVDLNVLAAPPEHNDFAPITLHDIDEMEPKHRWLPRLIIK